MLKPAIVAARITRDQLAPWREKLGQLDRLAPEGELRDAQANPEHAVELLVRFAGDFNVADLLKVEDVGVELDRAIHVVHIHRNRGDRGHAAEGSRAWRRDKRQAED